MKRLVLTLFAVCVCILSVQAAYAIQVTVDGNPVVFDQQPIMSGGRVLVPLRGVFEKLGAQVNYDNRNQSILCTSGSVQISLMVGNTAATVNGQSRTLDSAPIMVGGRVLVPLRFVSEAMGADVHWDDSQQLVSITSGTGHASNNTNTNTNNAYVPAPPPVQERSNPRIRSITLDSAGPLRPGQLLHVTLYGTEHGRAWFDIAGATGIRMEEGPAGTYHGSYTVRATDDSPKALVTGHLEIDDRQTAQNSQRTVALEGREQPRKVERDVRETRLINSVTHSPQNANRMGEIINVTMTGEPRGVATFDIGSHRGLLMTETAPGNYVGQFTLSLGDMEPNAPVIVHLRTRDGQTATSEDANPATLRGLP